MIHFSLPELCHSVTATLNGLDNIPTLAKATNLEYLVDTLLDPLRELYGEPIIVQSGYRCPTLNALVGGVPDSAHVDGLAADISSVGNDRTKNQSLVSLILSTPLPFDQLILYDCLRSGPRWLHVSLRLDPSQNRHHILHR